MADRPGGIVSLVALLDQRWDALEADFQDVYALDLRTVVWGPAPVGLRRLTALVRGLPSTGRVWEKENGRWGILEHLAASNLETTHAVFRAVLASIPQPAHRRRELPKALVVPRPGARHEQPRRVITPLDFMRMVKSG